MIGSVPPELWNRLGTKVLPKLRSGADLKVGVDFSLTVEEPAGRALQSELLQILDELGLRDRIRVESS